MTDHVMTVAQVGEARVRFELVGQKMSTRGHMAANKSRQSPFGAIGDKHGEAFTAVTVDAPEYPLMAAEVLTATIVARLSQAALIKFYVGCRTTNDLSGRNTAN